MIVSIIVLSACFVDDVIINNYIVYIPVDCIDDFVDEKTTNYTRSIRHAG